MRLSAALRSPAPDAALWAAALLLGMVMRLALCRIGTAFLVEVPRSTADAS